MTPISISAALNEVLGDTTPSPLNIKLSVGTAYEALGVVWLNTEDDLVGFVYRVAAAMHTPPATSAQKMIVGLSLNIFCRRRGIVVEGFGR